VVIATDRAVPEEWVLWAGTVGFSTALPERFAAAAAAGYQRVTLSPPDVERAAESGTSAQEIGRQARDLGLRLTVDPVMNWYPDSAPASSRFAGVGVDAALRICAEVGADSLSAIATQSSDVPLADLAEPFARLCDGAAEFGAEVHLEFIPFTIVRDLATAWDIVRAADRGNGGLVFDTWHFFRGSPDFELLARIPGERILHVQLDDAEAVPDGPLRAETQRRLLPGDGGLDLPRAVRALAAIGGLRRVGPEVISPVLAALPIREAAALALQRTRTAVAGAWV
jgi:sugar phosphate isomerase/epimerase